MTPEEIAALKAQGFHFRATAEGEIQFTPEEEAEWQAEQDALANTPPPRRLIPKSVVQERMNNIGKLDVTLAALQAAPIYFARWFAPDYPNVYFNDPDMLLLFGQVGLTPEQVEQVTAPV